MYCWTLDLFIRYKLGFLNTLTKWPLLIEFVALRILREPYFKPMKPLVRHQPDRPLFYCRPGAGVIPEYGVAQRGETFGIIMAGGRI